jgi:hypothetical protein
MAGRVITIRPTRCQADPVDIRAQDNPICAPLLMIAEEASPAPNGG